MRKRGTFWGEDVERAAFVGCGWGGRVSTKFRISEEMNLEGKHYFSLKSEDLRQFFYLFFYQVVGSSCTGIHRSVEAYFIKSDPFFTRKQSNGYLKVLITNMWASVWTLLSFLQGYGRCSRNFYKRFMLFQQSYFVCCGVNFKAFARAKRPKDRKQRDRDS